MAEHPRPSLALLARHRRRVGAGLLVAGGLLVGLTGLVATGIVPLWRPSVPPPPALVEARATRVTLPTRAAPTATAARLAVLTGDVVPPTRAAPPTPFSVPGAPPGTTLAPPQGVAGNGAD